MNKLALKGKLLSHVSKSGEGIDNLIIIGNRIGKDPSLFLSFVPIALLLIKLTHYPKQPHE